MPKVDLREQRRAERAAHRKRNTIIASVAGVAILVLVAIFLFELPSRLRASEVVDTVFPLSDGAIRPWDRDTQTIYHAMLESVAKQHHIPFDVPVSELSKHQMDTILYGGKKGETISVRYVNNDGHDRYFQTNYEGVVPNLQRRYRETTSDYIRSELERYMSSRPCPTCEGLFFI